MNYLLKKTVFQGHGLDLRTCHLQVVHAPVMKPAVVGLDEGALAELTLVADAEVLRLNVSPQHMFQVTLVAAYRTDKGSRGRLVDVAFNGSLAWKLSKFDRCHMHME